MDSFDEFVNKFKASKREVDIVNVKAEMKAFKDAYNHLIALTKTAINTLQKAHEAVKNKKKEKGGQPAKKLKVEATLFDIAQEKGTAMDERNFAGMTVPLDSLESPLILTNLPEFLWADGAGCCGSVQPPP